MAAKVFDAYGDLHVNTKKAEKDIKNVGKEFDGLDKAIDRMNNRMSRFGDTMLHADRMSASMSRRVRQGFLTGMEASLQRNESGLIALGNAFEVAGSGFRKTENESGLALKSFQSLQRRGYALQAALGSLAGTIGDLSGGVMSLVGVLGQAAYAFVGVGSALMSVVAGFAVAKIAMSGVGKAVSNLWNGQNQYNKSLRDARKELKDLKFDLEGAVLSEQEAAIELEKARTQLAMAQDLPPDNMVRRESELAFQRADLNYRRAKARVNDLQDTIKRGGNAAARAANADPFKGLTKSQIAFTKYLVTLKPQMQALKEAAASSFLPPLQTAIQTIVATTFPTLMQGFKTLGSAMGYAANQFANVFKQPESIEALQDFFTNSGKSLTQLGDAAGKFLSGFLKLLQSSQPVTDRFVTWIDSVASRFNAMADSATFKRFLEIAGYVASQISHVFGTFGDGIKNIMDANFPSGGGGAGQVMLDWLNGIAQSFKAFTGSSTFPKWLKETTTNATIALSTIGGFLNIFIDLAGRPEVRQFFESLAKSIPDITKILMDGLKAGPAFAEMLVSVIKLFTLFSDSGALESFFGTLKIIADTVNNIIAPFKPLIDIIGKFHGAVLAIGLGIIAFNTVGVLFMAMLGKVFKIIGQVVTGFTSVANAGNRFNTVLATSERPMGRWGRSMTNFIRGMGNANRAMNRNASDYFSLIGKEKEYAALLASKPTRLQRVVGALKIYREAIREAATSTTAKTATVQAGTAAEKAAGVAEKQRLSGFKLVKSSYKDMSASIKNYINSMREKTAADIASNAAAKEGLATANATNESLKKRSLINRMGGAGAGAGARGGGPGAMGAVGIGLAAQGLIAGASGGGMTAGSALTALGGAAMFVPGGMIPGLALGIVGSITQGFEAAEQAARDKQQTIIARSVEITAQRVETRSASALSELAQLMATGNYTYAEASAEVTNRERATTEIANQAGANDTKLDAIRKSFLAAGIDAQSKTMTTLLKAAATNLAFTKDKATAEDVSSAILSVFTSKGKGTAGLAEVVRLFGTAPTTPGAKTNAPFALNPEQPVTFETKDNRGVTTSGLTLPGQGVKDQERIIKDLLKDPKNYTVNAVRNVGGLLFDIKLFDAGLLSGFDSQAIENVNNTYGKKLNGYTQEILQEAAKGLPAKFDLYAPGTRNTTFAKPITLPGPTTAPLTPAQFKSLYAGTSGSFNFNTGAITPGTKGFSTTDISKLQGTATKPGIYTSVVPDVTSVTAQQDYDKKTLAALQALKGVVVEGEGLKIIDASPNDPIPPIILPRPNASFTEIEQVRLLNQEIRKAFGQ